MDETVGFTDRYVRAGGLRVHVLEGGAGPPLLLIHGLGGPLMWQRVLGPLSKRFRVMAVDLPGFGESDPVSWNPAERDPMGRDASFNGYGEFLFEVTEHMEVRNAIVCGISWGGQLAVQLADLHPDRVEKLILICTTGLRCHPLARNSLVRIILPPMLENTVLRSRFLIDYFSRRSFYNIENRPPDLCTQFQKGLRREGRSGAFLAALLDAAAGDPGFLERLSRLRIPSLIIWGKNDLIAPTEDAYRIGGAIPNAIVRIFPECGHSIPLEKPRELVDAFFVFKGQEGLPHGVNS
ncbi:MAG TPA: alpha/beta hydrolase [Bacteroidota bacterium]|nr:alpha/beta hydrolase [Bacteroidota bacterium]